MQDDRKSGENAYFDDSTPHNINSSHYSRTSQSKIYVSNSNTGAKTPVQKKNTNLIRDSTTGINCLKKLASI